MAWVSARSLAAHFDVSERTIWEWAKAGIIPPGASPSGGVRRWDVDEVDKWYRNGGSESSTKVDLLARIRRYGQAKKANTGDAKGRHRTL